jgi:hypothetical protein
VYLADTTTAEPAFTPLEWLSVAGAPVIHPSSTSAAYQLAFWRPVAAMAGDFVWQHELAAANIAHTVMLCRKYRY